MVQDIVLEQPNATIAISNGYHFLPPMHLQLRMQETKGFKVSTYLDNVRLGYIIFLTLFLFILSRLMHSTVVQVLANVPILAVCAYVFWNRKNLLYIEAL
jgi:hypothetical protein